MQKIIYQNKEKLEKTIKKIKEDWLENLHILADFDKTLTKAFYNWEKRPSLISILRSEWILWEDYSKKAYELYDEYHPFEIDPNIPLEEKKKQMNNWWRRHFFLLARCWLKKEDIKKAVDLWKIEFREWVKDFFSFLQENDIPLVIISANWLWGDSIEYFFEKSKISLNNIFVVSNKLAFDGTWRAIWYVIVWVVNLLSNPLSTIKPWLPHSS